MLRFATSPTGDMHIENLRVALFNYIISKQKKDDLIVRIDYTKRDVAGKDQEILDILGLFGIEYSQVIYQTKNFRFYSAMALQLLHEKKAFSCFCSPEWIGKKQKEAEDANKPYLYDDACANLPAELVIDNMNPFVIRIKKPTDAITVKDYINGELTFNPKDLDSFMIMNQDKTPISDFACAIDDMLNDISLIIRSKKYIENTQKQEHIRASLGYDKKIEYAHLATIIDGDSLSVKSFLEDGFLPSAIANYLILLGNKTPKEIFTIDEAIEWIDLTKLSTQPINFDIDKLKKINNQHLRDLDAKELSRYVGFADDEIGKLARVYLDEVDTTKELKTKISPIFADKKIPKELLEYTDIITKSVKQAPFFDEYNQFEKYLIETSGLTKEELSKPLRYLLTGVEDGPDLSLIYKYLKNYIGGIVK